MAEFCNQCAVDLMLPHGDFKGLAKRNHVAEALCEGCGAIYVDPDGNCMGDNPQWPPAEPGDMTCKRRHPSRWPT